MPRPPHKSLHLTQMCVPSTAQIITFDGKYVPSTTQIITFDAKYVPSTTQIVTFDEQRIIFDTKACALYRIKHIF